MDYWGTYTRPVVEGQEGEAATVLLQADPVNRARYERKGFTFKEYSQAPGVGPALQACSPPNAAEQIFGFLENGSTDLDASEVVKQAAEVALRKMTGTWTQAEAVAEEEAHLEGRLLPEETPEVITGGGDILAGYKALAGQELSTTRLFGANVPLSDGSNGESAPATAPVATTTGEGEAGTGTQPATP